MFKKRLVNKLAIGKILVVLYDGEDRGNYREKYFFPLSLSFFVQEDFEEIQPLGSEVEPLLHECTRNVLWLKRLIHLW